MLPEEDLFVRTLQNTNHTFPYRCHEGYSGERCHDIIWLLPSSGTDKGYNRTTALAVVAVVLSSLCLIIIGLLLALRLVYHMLPGGGVLLATLKK